MQIIRRTDYTYVTKRTVSMFKQDIESNADALLQKIQGKSVLIIGGAGSNGLQMKELQLGQL